MGKPAQGSHFAIGRKMGSPQITVAFVVCVAFIILIAGCEGENLSDTKSNIEKSRLIAIENIQLKEQLEQRDKEIERQKELLEKCLRGQPTDFQFYGEST